MAKGVTIDGRKLCDLWEKSMLSQESFATKAGMKRSNLFRLTREGRHGIHRDTLQGLAVALKMSVDDLLRQIGVAEENAEAETQQQKLARLRQLFLESNLPLKDVIKTLTTADQIEQRQLGKAASQSEAARNKAEGKGKRKE